ncbi:hypothetical protein ABN763_06975 [Spongiivirga sp. MCCC 1A20706]|uniref:hypothetical protein n=1 Tax=Spongiivirga sp. MCCC 1A20706 TaxID=3160963 RepID=UPI003977442B
MEKRTNPHNFSLTGVMCSVFGHNFKVTRQVTRHIKEYECVHCKTQATTDVSGNLASLTNKRKEINQSLSELYQKKLSRKRRLAV